MTDIERLRAERNFLLDALQRAHEYAQRGDKHGTELTLHDGVYGFQAMKAELHDRQRQVARNEVDRIRVEAAGLVKRAERSGVVLTVEQVPLKPLATGHYATVVSTRVARGGYQ